MYISHEVKECDTLGFELEMKLNRKDAACTTILEHDYKLNSKLKQNVELSRPLPWLQQKLKLHLEYKC